MNIDERGFWKNNSEEGHGIDRHLARALREFFEEEQKSSIFHDSDPNRISKLGIADVGCGTGFYTKFLNESPYLSATGYDGNPFTPEVAGSEFKVWDFSKPIDWLVDEMFMYDWVLSLEVGEHIPQKYENNFLKNITEMAEFGIVLSWAIEGQGGDGHVNCRNNDYIVDKLYRLGFGFLPETTHNMRLKCAEYPHTGWWFRDTIMIFRKVN